MPANKNFYLEDKTLWIAPQTLRPTTSKISASRIILHKKVHLKKIHEGEISWELKKSFFFF